MANNRSGSSRSDQGNRSGGQSGRSSGGSSRSGNRERIENPRTGPTYVRRDEEGKFEEVENVGRAAAGDNRRDAMNQSRPGAGDRGDRDTTPNSRGRGGSQGRSQSRARNSRDE